MPDQDLRAFEEKKSGFALIENPNKLSIID
jgi:hypothetical protein